MESTRLLQIVDQALLFPSWVINSMPNPSVRRNSKHIEIRASDVILVILQVDLAYLEAGNYFKEVCLSLCATHFFQGSINKVSCAPLMYLTLTVPNLSVIFTSQVSDKFYYFWTTLAEMVFIIFYAGDEFD